jgi:hypothetical protein
MCACGPATTDDPDPEPTCQDDSDCDEGSYCVFGQGCEANPFADTTRTELAAFFPSADGQRYVFDDVIAVDGMSNPTPGTCLQAWRSGGGMFDVKADFITDATVGSTLSVGPDLRFYGMSSDQNNAFDFQAVSGEVEITAVEDDAVTVDYTFRVVDLDTDDASCDPDFGSCYDVTGSGTVALRCVPAAE